MESVIHNDEKVAILLIQIQIQKILCGYRVMEYLAPVVSNFPLPIDEFGVLEVDDYEGALTALRLWFKQNPEYIIDQNTF